MLIRLLFIHENIAIVELALIDFDYTCDGIVCLRVYTAAETDNGYVANVNIAVFYASAALFLQFVCEKKQFVA